MTLTLMPRDVIDATRQRIVAVERRHRLTGAAIVGLIFVLFFILISNRINRLLKRVAAFSSRALHIEQPMPQGGNRLLIMEDWIRSFTQAVIKAREEMRAHFTAEIREREALKTAVQASLRSRERFWDIRVPKIDSIFDNSLVPRPSWSPGVPPQHRKLVAATHRSPI